MKVALYCTCGDAVYGKSNQVVAEGLKEFWAKLHHGEGHALCDAATARKARRQKGKLPSPKLTCSPN